MLLDIGLNLVTTFPNKKVHFIFLLLSLYNIKYHTDLANSKLYSIVNQPHIRIYAPETSHFSIGTSPYYAHQYALGIDIYDQLTIQNYEVVSPVSGKVLQIRDMRAPKPKFNDGIDREYLTVIQNIDGENTVFKILHIKPALDVGQNIEPGDILGTTIRNGYFAPWSSPHIHLEIKKPEDVLRAKKGLPFTLNTKSRPIKNVLKKSIYCEQIPVEIISTFDEFFLCRIPDNLYLNIPPFFGVKGSTKQVNYILDAGIPQYKHGIVHFLTGEDAQDVNQIYLNNIQIGSINGFYKKYGFANFNKVKIQLNNRSIRGISFFLAKFQPLIKIIPFHKGDFQIKERSTHQLKIIGI